MGLPFVADRFVPLARGLAFDLATGEHAWL
jgi:hypothetical protein